MEKGKSSFSLYVIVRLLYLSCMRYRRMLCTLFHSRTTAAYSVAMQPCSYPGGNTVATNNISILVNKYRRLRRLLVPFYDLFEIVSYIRRYREAAVTSCSYFARDTFPLSRAVGTKQRATFCRCETRLEGWGRAAPRIWM